MASTAHLRLGTRGSALARWQADWVSARLTELNIDVEIVHITTGGDVKTEPIGQIGGGGQGLFTKEIQRALLDDRIDLAVHSLKDLPTEPVDGLMLAVVPPREGCGDVLVCNGADTIEALPSGARIGTGSMRRRSQLLYHRRDLQVLDIRGNLDTRLKKLDDGDYDAIVLAEAGLKRLGWADRIAQVIPQSIMLPAVGQGALGIETRRDDRATLECLQPLDHSETHASVVAERAMLAALRGGCLAPVGAWGRLDGEELKLDGVVLDGDGNNRVTASASGSQDRAEAIGIEVAEQLLTLGAAELIASSRAS